MLTIDVDDFAIELKEGTIRTVGAANKHGTAKLFDVDAVEAREYGGDRIKIEANDGDGNVVQIALDEAEAKTLTAALSELVN